MAEENMGLIAWVVTSIHIEASPRNINITFVPRILYSVNNNVWLILERHNGIPVINHSDRIRPTRPAIR